MPDTIGSADISDMSAADLLRRYRDRSLSPREVAADVLARIEAFNPIINAFCHLDGESVEDAARASEDRWVRGEPAGVLDGVPVTIKDLTDVAGMPTRKGSLTTSDQPAAADAPFAARIRQAGGLILGKTTTPEYGWKGVTDSALTGATRNPWNTAMTPGGSSGGAAAAAALNLGCLHQGSDGGGSIRIPCGFTGTVGIKPTFGWIPQLPASVMTLLSHLGPIGRTVDDLIRMIDVVAVPDPRDWYTMRPDQSRFPAPDRSGVAGLRIAYSPDLGHAAVDPEVRACLDRAVAVLADMGADVEQVDPGFEDPVDVFRTFWFSGAARLVAMTPPDRRPQMDPGLLDAAEAGAALSALDYLAADAARAALGAAMAAFHDRFDLLATPTLAIAAFPVGRNLPDPSSGRDWTHWTPFSYPFNITQQPAASVPCGFTDDGLPVGLHLVAAKFRDDLVLQAARSFLEAVPPRFPAAPVGEPD